MVKDLSNLGKEDVIETFKKALTDSGLEMSFTNIVVGKMKDGSFLIETPNIIISKTKK